MATYKEVYYNIPEEDMQKLIKKAKLGDGAAQQELLKVFNNFLTKYVTLLYYGKYNLGDYDIRRFTALFVKDPTTLFYLKRNKLNDQGYKHVNECVRGVQYMVQRYGDEDDVRQTISMTFLQCLDRYKPTQSKVKPGEIVPFKGYVYSYFFYMLKKNVDSLLIDQLGRKTFPLLADEDTGEDEDGEKVQGFTAPPEPSVEELLGPDEINEFWVAGDTAIFPFDQLSVQERQLIKWRFVDGYRSSEIAQKITEHSNTVRDHFKKIRAHLKELMGEEFYVG